MLFYLRIIFKVVVHGFLRLRYIGSPIPRHQTIAIQPTLSISLLLMGFKLMAGAVASCALIGVAVGVGIIYGSLLISIGRNPSQRDELLRYAFIGFSLVEVSGLIGLVISLLLLFGFQNHRNSLFRSEIVPDRSKWVGFQVQVPIHLLCYSLLNHYLCLGVNIQ